MLLKPDFLVLLWRTLTILVTAFQFLFADDAIIVDIQFAERFGVAFPFFAGKTDGVQYSKFLQMMNWIHSVRESRIELDGSKTRFIPLSHHGERG